MNWDDTANEVMAVAEKMTQLDQMLRAGGAHDFYFKKMRGYAEALFNRFAPFKKGDRVELASTPTITQEASPGWMGSKHFLVKGAKGTVHSIDLDEGTQKFTALVQFDGETWIPDFDNPGKYKKGELQPVTEKHVYYFSEEWLRRI